jgi:hypothetical protein
LKPLDDLIEALYDLLTQGINPRGGAPVAEPIQAVDSACISARQE